MSLLQMSVQAGVLIVAIVLLRAVALEKLPKNAFLLLWGVALARLLLPFSFSWSFLTRFFPAGGKDKAVKSLLPDYGTPPPVAFPLTGQTASVDAALQGQAEPFPWPMAIWIGGMVLLAAFFLVAYIRSSRALRLALPTDSPFIREWQQSHKLLRPLTILQSDQITTPLALGILRPRILLPKSLELNGGRLVHYVLAHEYFHIRRLDALWKLLMLTALCLHWYNPLVWVMAFLVSRDLEITCDELVLRHFGVAQKAEYAHSIIHLAEQRSKLSPISSGFGKNPAEERIIAIMKYKKASILAIFSAVLLVLASITVFAVDRNDQSLPESPESNGSFQGTAEVLLAKLDTDREQYTITSVNQILSHPELEFYIEGQNIARIDLYSQNEYLNLVDWAGQTVSYDEESLTTAFSEQAYAKHASIVFEKGFTEYDQIWYRWYGLNLDAWAKEDDYSHILLSEVDTSTLSEEKKSPLAAGDDGTGTTGLGHVQVEGYPEALLEDTITIVLTDWEGNTTARTIYIQVRNDGKNQLNITASLEK